MRLKISCHELISDSVTNEEADHPFAEKLVKSRVRLVVQRVAIHSIYTDWKSFAYSNKIPISDEHDDDAHKSTEMQQKKNSLWATLFAHGWGEFHKASPLTGQPLRRLTMNHRWSGWSSSTKQRNNTHLHGVYVSTQLLHCYGVPRIIWEEIASLRSHWSFDGFLPPPYLPLMNDFCLSSSSSSASPLAAHSQQYVVVACRSWLIVCDASSSWSSLKIPYVR